MEINLPLILFVIAFIAVISIAYKRYSRNKPQPPQQLPPHLGNVDEINEEDAVDRYAQHAAVNHARNRGEYNFSSSIDDSAFAALGFDNINSLLTEPPKRQAAPVTSMEQKSAPKDQSLSKSKIISLYLMAANGREFIGYELLQALLAAGLRYGAMSIFHRYAETNGDREILFSLASAKEPGIFDISNMGAVSCAGLSMFMDISKSSNPQIAFELMMETAYQLADDLGGEIFDEKRLPLTDNKIMEYKQRITNFLNVTADSI